MRLLLAVVAVSCLAVASASLSGNTFCERYSQALFADAFGPTTQRGLVNAVVNRAFAGGSSPNWPNNVTGLVNEPHNAPYFNGSSYPFINYLNPNNSAQLTTLVDHLDRFFMFGLQCRNGSAAQPWSPVSLYGIHSAMGINAVTEAAFVGQVAASMTSFGVPAGTGLATDDITYVAALMGLFNRYTGSSILQICADASCPLATGFYEFDILPSGQFMDISLLVGTGGTSVTLNPGDYVHWNLGLTDGVTQASDATSTTALSGGISSGTGIRSFTKAFTTPGTYYFYNTGSTSNRCTVTVTGSVSSSSTASMMTSSSSSSTGSTMTSSTGVNGASSMMTASRAIVAAIIVAVAALFA